MSSKLDQSLDTIMSEAGTARSGRGRVRRRGARAAPVGGVRKSTRAAAATANAKNTTKPATKAAATTPASGASAKVIVSNLEFFTKVAGPIKRVQLTYGPNGQSRGVATILFASPAAGAKALQQNGTLVDKRALRIEAVLDVNAAGNSAKSLSERVTAPNAQPKKAVVEKAKAAKETAPRGGKTAAQGRGRGGRNARNGRPKKKTAAELDAEMTDYFGTNSNAAAAGPAATGPAAPAAASTAAPAAAAPAGDDLGMDDIS